MKKKFLKNIVANLLYAIYIELMTILKREILGVKAVVLNDSNKKLLLVRHSYKGASRWYLPGGGVRSGERPDKALARELKEELGLVVNAPILAGIYRGKKRRLTFLFICNSRYDVSIFNPRQLEIEEVSFFSFNKLPKNLSPGVRIRIKDVGFFLKKKSGSIVWGSW